MTTFPSPLVTSYFDYLPTDIQALVASYALCTIDHSAAPVSAMFSQPMFARLTASTQWHRVLAERPRNIYRCYWSSTDDLIFPHLQYDGAVDYARTVAAAHRIVSVCPLLDISRDSQSDMLWANTAQYDVLRTRLRDDIAIQLGRVRQASTASVEHSRTLFACLRRVVNLPDVMTLPHPTLDQEIVASCAQVAGLAVSRDGGCAGVQSKELRRVGVDKSLVTPLPILYDLFRRATCLRVNYFLWRTLYHHHLRLLVAPTVLKQGRG